METTAENLNSLTLTKEQILCLMGRARIVSLTIEQILYDFIEEMESVDNFKEKK